METFGDGSIATLTSRNSTIVSPPPTSFFTNVFRALSTRSNALAIHLRASFEQSRSSLKYSEIERTAWRFAEVAMVSEPAGFLRNDCKAANA